MQHKKKASHILTLDIIGNVRFQHSGFVQEHRGVVLYVEYALHRICHVVMGLLPLFYGESFGFGVTR